MQFWGVRWLGVPNRPFCGSFSFARAPLARAARSVASGARTLGTRRSLAVRHPRRRPCYTPPVLSAPPGAATDCVITIERGVSHGKESRSPCVVTNSCWSCVPMSRRTACRPSSTGPPGPITGAAGQIVKVSPWGRRRLAYPIGAYREGSYYIVVFEAPSEAVLELERGLNITEEVMRHLVTRVERPTARAARTPRRRRGHRRSGRRAAAGRR